MTSELAMANAWTTETVDAPGNVGKENSIVIDSNNYPHISYVDLATETLKYARWTGSVWDIQTVDNAGAVGLFTSMVLDINEYPHISYLDYTDFKDGDLKYARWDGAQWNIEVVESAGNVGKYSSLALDSMGYPHISYFDETEIAPFSYRNDLRYARWNGTDWNAEVVDSAGNTGHLTSIAIDSNDHPHIGYYQAGGGSLKYARWDGAQWNLEVVESIGLVGIYPSLKLNSNDYPRMSYFYLDTADLRYARWDGAQWVIEVVDSAGSVGSFTSLALDNNEYPHISYYDEGLGDVKYAKWTGSEWSIEIADALGTVGSHTSIALDSIGNVHIAYYHLFYGDLLYAKRSNAPSAPRNLQAVPGNAQATLSWDEPLSDCGQPIAFYEVYRGNASGGETFLVEIGNVLGYTDMGLTNGQTYYYKVSAVNAAGEGPLSTEASVIPVGPPDPPENLGVSSGDSWVNLTWSAPSSDGGLPITNYRVHRGTSSEGEVFFADAGNSYHLNDTSVSNGITYYYKVSAVNGVGEGGLSDEAIATPMGTPSFPKNLQAVSADSLVTLTWSTPDLDGGSPITNYRIYRGITSGGEIFHIEVNAVLKYADTGLINGQTYYYRVSAVNAVGEGSLSAEAYEKPATIPEAPTSVTAASGNSYVNVSWEIPGSDGGYQIENYLIYRGTTPGGEVFITEIGVYTNYNDTGLGNDISYYYKVSAKNELGEGPLSEEVSATPYNQPPTCIVTSPSQGSTATGLIVIAGTSSDDDGSVHWVEMKVDESGWERAGGTTSWSHSWDTSSVTNGQHTVYVRSFDGANYSIIESIAVTVDNPEEAFFEELWFWVMVPLILFIIILLAVLLVRRRQKERIASSQIKPEDETQGEGPNKD